MAAQHNNHNAPFTSAYVIGATIRGRKAGECKKKDPLHGVKVAVANNGRLSPNYMLILFVKGWERVGALITLSDITTIEQRDQPSEMHHYKGHASVVVDVLLKPHGANVSEGVYIAGQPRHNRYRNICV